MGAERSKPSVRRSDPDQKRSKRMGTAVTESTTDLGAQAIRPFSALRVHDVHYAGGRGANLGELAAAGMPVPPGFVVGARAYAAFCEQTGLRTELARLLDGVDVEDTAALQQAAAAAPALFDDTPMPDW